MKNTYSIFILTALCGFVLVGFRIAFPGTLGIAYADEESEALKKEKKEEQVTRTEVVVVAPGRTVLVEEKRMVEYKDSDRDGLADKDDSHPDVAEIYVVKDEDGNGISDIWDVLRFKLAKLR